MHLKYIWNNELTWFRSLALLLGGGDNSIYLVLGELRSVSSISEHLRPAVVSASRKFPLSFAA